MTSGRRFRLSATEKAEVWQRWKNGQSLHAIGRALSRAHPVVHRLLKQHGGIAPPVHRRSQRVLTLAEREDISRGIASGCSLRDIAQRLRRAPCTVSREVARHGGRSIERVKPMSGLGIRRCGPSHVCWPLTASYNGSLRVN